MYKCVLKEWEWLGPYTSDGAYYWYRWCQTYKVITPSFFNGICWWRSKSLGHTSSTACYMTFNITMVLSDFVGQQKDGSSPAILHYHRLNIVIHNDTYLVPKVHDCLDAIMGGDMFSTMDFLSAYNQVLVAEKNTHTTAFTA